MNSNFRRIKAVALTLMAVLLSVGFSSIDFRAGYARRANANHDKMKPVSENLNKLSRKAETSSLRDPANALKILKKLILRKLYLKASGRKIIKGTYLRKVCPCKVMADNPSGTANKTALMNRVKMLSKLCLNKLVILKHKTIANGMSGITKKRFGASIISFKRSRVIFCGRKKF